MHRRGSRLLHRTARRVDSIRESESRRLPSRNETGNPIANFRGHTVFSKDGVREMPELSLSPWGQVYRRGALRHRCLNLSNGWSPGLGERGTARSYGKIPRNQPARSVAGAPAPRAAAEESLTGIGISARTFSTHISDAHSQKECSKRYREDSAARTCRRRDASLSMQAEEQADESMQAVELTVRRRLAAESPEYTQRRWPWTGLNTDFPRPGESVENPKKTENH